MVSEGVRQKFTSIYRTFHDIDKLKVRIKLKEVETSDAHQSSVEGDEEWETKTISWQQKIYSNFEREFYKDQRNCLTDREKEYHRDVVNLVQETGSFFTYTDLDNINFDEEKCVSGTNVVTKLLKNMKVGDGGSDELDTSDPTLLVAQLESNPVCVDDFETMHIMADFGEYIGDTWYKLDYTLCTIKWNAAKKILSVYPDFSIFEPYSIRIENDSTRTFLYRIENVADSPSGGGPTRQNTISKVHERHKRLQYNTSDFDFDHPPKSKIMFHLFFEIATGRHFEYNNIYVEYYIDLPNGWTSRDGPLTGSTHSCSKGDRNGVLYYGHSFDVTLECDIQGFAKDGIKNPYIYFEVVSKDSWDRFRCEGLAYISLPVAVPGRHHYDLHCFRMIHSWPYSELRRSFIGDYRNYDDITSIAIPRNFEGTVMNKIAMKTVGTGELKVNVSVVQQSSALELDDDPEMPNYGRRGRFVLEKLRDSGLVRSVEEVVMAFKRAKRNMIEVRRAMIDTNLKKKL